ncbi:MAG: hypothetical protein NTV06_04695 [candidate division Zixibacteria bacterium]|nr:hypothetical protein [candidate division Zixibacteria bacterium]
MKHFLFFALGGLLLLATVAPMAQDQPKEKPWFDMQNCDFCKNLIKDTLLLPNTIWEHHDISNGLMIVTLVKPEYMASYKKAMDDMSKVGQEMMQGKPVKMCGFCEAYGKLIMAGAKIENIMGDWGEVTLITSDKPETLIMIREYAQCTREELAKMAKK